MTNPFVTDAEQRALAMVQAALARRQARLAAAKAQEAAKLGRN